ncbi:tRNA (adenosine(37)-N6)-threonylcarbamoyltransferase complex ATPase subunit type 1 TsaE [Legionella londiniensis]|uniref:tRNA threonylcarbamoyladenosine biosynthesis protein TsaE n=1 Tax=Legionella londiniensis TaxID=45068 RepID=A0A0W0VIF5_9GAMM|nr:tRNA (adenosine(37)-N6)-threonylcarbamoyltransferase complex ATPase subunit type 1 TsaE [Legionella londiniensis]KTD19677.1 ATPase or kinase [Legionella londiniensis]STX92413.1 ATPase or kinase [Legionella londiniensis]
MSLIISLPTEDKSIKTAEKLAYCLSSSTVLTFSGEIGAGKTTFIRALLRTLGITSAIKSPTFSLVESYQTDRYPVHHFDLYRIHDQSELEYIGFRDYFSENAVCCIEWPEHAPGSLPKIDLAFHLFFKGSGREMQVEAHSEAGNYILNCLLGDA